MKLEEVQINDRVILPPLGSQVNQEYHIVKRETCRRVLHIEREGDSVTITLDGQEPRTLPASLEVWVLR